MGDTWDFVNGDGGAEVLPSGRFNKWGGNLRNDGRKVRINRDRNGKVVSYSTTDSTVAKIGRSYYVLPTVANGKTVADPVARFNDTGEFWAKAGSEKEARRLANEVHNHHAKRYQKLWNEYIQSNWDDMSPEITEDKTLSDVHAARTYMADLADTGSSDNLPNGPLVSKAYDLMVLTPGVEGFDPVARWDVDGYALGHGAHIWRGEKVKQGQTAGWKDAAEQFRIDIEDRIGRMERLVPRFGELPDTHKLAILDIAMGKNGQLTESNSRILFGKLRSATTEKGLRDAVESEYHTYGANVGADIRGRRVTVAKALFGKNLVYDLGADGKYKGRYEETQQAAKGGDTPGESKSSSVPKGHNAALDGYTGPRIVINPSTFRNEKDALCVAFDEAFRVVMEMNGFDPVAEPTKKQREFFSDTAYANDERMLRRTILARICTFDTSVTDPTDEQLEEAVEFLYTVLEVGAPQNQWEQRAVERIRTAVEKSVGQPKASDVQARPPAGGPVTAAAGGGETEEEAMRRLAEGASGTSVQEDTSTLAERERFLEERGMDKSLAETGSMEQLVRMHTEEVQGPAGSSGDEGRASGPDLADNQNTDRPTDRPTEATRGDLEQKIDDGIAKAMNQLADWMTDAAHKLDEAERNGTFDWSPLTGKPSRVPGAAATAVPASDEGNLRSAEPPKYIRSEKSGLMVLNRDGIIPERRNTDRTEGATPGGGVMSADDAKAMYAANKERNVMNRSDVLEMYDRNRIRPREAWRTRGVI